MDEYIKSMRQLIGNSRLLLVGVGIFVYTDNKILLQKRRDNGKWSFHGGYLELGENIENAAKRELFEETGLTANHLDFIGFCSGEDMFFTYPNGDQVYIVGMYWKCSSFKGELLPDTDETLELKWFDLNDLPTDISPHDKKPLDLFISRLKNKSEAIFQE